jgi:hypothetical protein
MVIINFVSNFFFFFGFTNIMMGPSNTIMITPIRIIIINLSGLTFLIRKKVQIFVFNEYFVFKLFINVFILKKKYITNGALFLLLENSKIKRSKKLLGTFGC